MAGIELLIGPDAFWRRLEPEIVAATDRVLVQAMTFEGDATGRKVAAAVAASRAADRRVLVDRFTRFVVSDRFVFTPRNLVDAGVRAEVRETRRMFAGLAADGVGVRWTNPAGLLLWRFPLRNHKKLVVVDDAVYVGGINFSDHNFAWHDMMVRIDDPAAARFFARDFDATFEGRPVAAEAELGDVSAYSLDGRHNAQGFAPILARIESAAASIRVVSPYLTFPFTDALAAAARRGVAVEILTPRDNNKPTIQHSLLRDAAKYGFAVFLQPGMQHLKAMVIDDRELIAGSSNFDFVSYAAQEEFVVAIRQPAAVQAFLDQVVKPGRAQAAQWVPGVTGPSINGPGVIGEASLRIAAAYARLFRGARRGVIAFRHG